MPRTRRKTISRSVAEDEAVRRYRVGEPVADLTRDLGINRTRLYRILKRHGVTPTRHVETWWPEARRLVDVFRMSPRDVALKLGKSRTAVDNALRQYPSPRQEEEEA